MKKPGMLFTFFDNIESYICRTLLATFCVLLFVQIVSREIFSHSVAWIEEVSVYMFVWFVLFGASYAARMSAHNRVTVQLKLLPRKVATAVEVCADFVWLTFNIYFVYLSADFVFNKMNLFWKSQTTGIPMKYIYIILPLSFTLMSIRIIQVNYYKLIKGIDVLDPEAVERKHIMDHEMEHKTEVEKLLESESKKKPNA